jgi:uncharacterized protein (DUF849 family)
MMDGLPPIHVVLPGPGAPRAQLTSEAMACANTGARLIHGSAIDQGAQSTLSAEAVADWLIALAEANAALVPTVDLGQAGELSLSLLRSWTRLPPFVSIDFTVAGAEQAADLMLSRSVGVEACLSGRLSVERFLRMERRRFCRRIVLRVPDLSPERADEHLMDLLRALSGATAWHDLILEGRGRSTWSMAERAFRGGFGLRIGPRLSSVLPDGRPAASAAEIFAAARHLYSVVGRHWERASTTLPV